MGESTNVPLWLLKVMQFLGQNHRTYNAYFFVIKIGDKRLLIVEQRNNIANVLKKMFNLQKIFPKMSVFD